MRWRDDHLYAHLVWATWDREPWLTPDLEPTVIACIGDQCQRLGAEIVALEAVPDHVHLLVKLPTRISVAVLVKQVKGASTHLLNATRSDDEAKYLWQGSYGAYSVSRSDLPRVQRYVMCQKEHHADGGDDSERERW